MNEAATQDVREMTLEPVLSQLSHTGTAPSARDAAMLSLLDAWHADGGSRLDCTGNGQITDPGAAVTDTAWPLLAGAWAWSVDKDLRTMLGQHVISFSGHAPEDTGRHELLERSVPALAGTEPFQSLLHLAQ